MPATRVRRADAKAVPQRDPLLSVPDVQSYLGNVSHGYVRKLARDGTVPSVRIGSRLMFRLSSIETFIESNRQDR